MALPKLERNCSAVRDTDLCSLAGFLNTGSVACNAESGSLSTPLIWVASMPTAAAPLFIPQQFLGDHAPVLSRRTLGPLDAVTIGRRAGTRSNRAGVRPESQNCKDGLPRPVS
jgi:hypothetical protein